MLNHATFAEAVMYSCVGDMMLPHLKDPADSKFRRHCRDWIYKVSINLWNHILQPYFLIVTPERTDDPQVKRLITRGASWREPLNPDI